MFEVFDKSGKKVVVYAVRSIDENTEFLLYVGQWEWFSADNFYASKC